MPLMDQLAQAMVAAMKSRDEARLSALRLMKAALMKQKVDSPKPVDEAAEMQVLKTLIKQRIEAAEAFRKAGRVEQAEKEEAERALIESYLPAAATEQEQRGKLSVEAWQQHLLSIVIPPAKSTTP